MSNDPTDLRGQERTRAEAERNERPARETEEGDIKWLVSSKRGRRIVWRMLEQAGVFRVSFNTNSMTMAFQEGNRNSGNRMLAMVTDISPDAFTLMLKEAKEQPEKSA